MANIIRTFDTAYEKFQRKGWDRLYVVVDIHDTIFKSCYYDKEEYLYFPAAREALRLLSNRDDIILILWSSSYTVNIFKYIDRLEKDKIHIDYVGENPEVDDTRLASFKSKFYFNVGIDNKFGFDPESEWKDIYYYFVAKLHEENKQKGLL